MPGRTVLLAVDDSENSVKEVQAAVSQLHRPDDLYHVLHVIPRLDPPSQFGLMAVDLMPDQDPQCYQARLRRATEFLKTRIIPCLPPGGPDPVLHIIKTEFTAESIGQTICAKGTELEADYIALSARHLSGLQKFLTASVTAYCVAHARCPVLVCPGDENA